MNGYYDYAILKPTGPDPANLCEGRLTMKYVCSICGYVYDEEAGDPDNGIEPGTKFEDLPDDFACPLCGAGKEAFEAEEE